jgi:hypothetical protein
MSRQQQQQQIKLEDDNSSIGDDDFVRLDDQTQTTPNNKAVQQQQQHGNGTYWNPLDLPSSMEIDELKLKVAALEVCNKLISHVGMINFNPF